VAAMRLGLRSGMEPDDHTLISDVLRGNTGAFETLIVRYQGRIFASVRRHVNSQSDAEDIVQQVFIKAFTKLASFRGDAPFEHWLMRLTVRTCLDFLRAQRRKPETLFSELSEAESAWLQQNWSEAGGEDDDAVAARELIHRLLAQLSAPSRLVITLLEIEERSVKEIAQLTGWSVPLVKVRAFRARRQMRQMLERMADTNFGVTRRP
jgi:RNA polymerase sigma-70 factor, ECF subfamily